MPSCFQVKTSLVASISRRFARTVSVVEETPRVFDRQRNRIEYKSTGRLRHD